MSEVWTGLEHKFWNIFRESELDSHDKFVLAVSGGHDSMVLLDVFLRLRPQAELRVAHYHHGPCGDQEQEQFRRIALESVKQKIFEVNRPNVTFCTETSLLELNSEEQMRNSRWQFLKSLAKPGYVVVTAHHLDDRLETMLLKMIRGTALDGFLAFTIWNKEVFRPLLSSTKLELVEYAKLRGTSWVEDPSNKSENYLRNWIREKWLKELDNRVESGSKNLAKSLLKIAESSNENQTFELELMPNKDVFVLSRQWYVSLSGSDQLRALALFLKKHQIYTFTSGQLAEIRKRLDKNQKDIIFTLLGKKWVINASQIMLQ